MPEHHGHQVKVSLLPVEKTHVEAAAASAGLPVSGWLRWLVRLRLPATAAGGLASERSSVLHRDGWDDDAERVELGACVKLRLDDADHAALLRVAETSGASVSACIRRMIQRHFDKRPRPTPAASGATPTNQPTNQPTKRRRAQG